MTGNIRIKDMAAGERPRERLVTCGAEALKAEELIAILLRTGTQGVSALDAARQLVNRFQSLDQLSRATLDEISQIKGIGRAKAIGLKSAFTLAQRLAREINADAPLLDTPESVAGYLREANRAYNVERLQVVSLSTRGRLIRVEELAHGTLNSILAHPREVFRAAIAANAASVILVHNHPSGDPTPSSADIQVTRDLIRAGRLLKIEVTDHVIIGRRTEERPRDYVSLRELGYFAD